MVHEVLLAIVTGLLNGGVGGGGGGGAAVSARVSVPVMLVFESLLLPPTLYPYVSPATTPNEWLP